MRFIPKLISNASRDLDDDEFVPDVEQDLAACFALSPVDSYIHDTQEKRHEVEEKHKATAGRITRLRADLAAEEEKHRQEAVVLAILAKCEELAKAGKTGPLQIAAAAE